MTSTIWILLIITTWLPQNLYGTATERAGRTIQMADNNQAVVHFHIPEYFDLKGEKFNSFMEMLRERANMLHENEVRRNEMHERCLWVFLAIFFGYTLISIIWITTNYIFYARQRRKLKKNGSKKAKSQIQERERLLERYYQIPSVEPPFIISHSSSSVSESVGALSVSNISDHCSFEENRARVEAILKRNNEPQFMRRI